MTKYWEQPLETLTHEQWESLCDGCGRCCLQKLQDEDTDEVVFTQISCEFLNTDTCRCTVYPDRATKKPNCSVIDRNQADHFTWLPDTCAYRLRHEGKPLPTWHPLLGGTLDDRLAAGIPVYEWCIPEHVIPEQDWADYILESE
ncbi:MAG: putative cysteine cluster protein YcgN (CxxCxxCC family) [Saprospiraceae bacterium]|jgi:uncharacterized cysteine cluster protein YcgN (CxxCxxCC family)